MDILKKQRCQECYSAADRITPLLHPKDCLQQHTQYICGTCGRCICIQKDEKRGLQRWNFPFRSLDIAILYLRTADYTMKKACGIYEIVTDKGRKSYKIFAEHEQLVEYLMHHKDRTCISMAPVFQYERYVDFPNTQVRKLEVDEIECYLQEQESRA